MYRGVCVCVGGVTLLILSNFSYISHENEIIWEGGSSRIFLKRGRG